MLVDPPAAAGCPALVLGGGPVGNGGKTGTVGGSTTVGVVVGCTDPPIGVSC